MDHALGMRGVERAADLLYDRDGFFRARTFLAAQMRAQVFAVNIFHADEANALSLAQIENADHILVRDIAGENELLLEAQQNRGIGCQFGTDNFERDQAVEFAVTRLVDCAHAALPEHAQDLVAFTEKHARLQTLKGGDAADDGETWRRA